MKHFPLNDHQQKHLEECIENACSGQFAATSDIEAIIADIHEMYSMGLITPIERRNQIINAVTKWYLEVNNIGLVEMPLDYEARVLIYTAAQNEDQAAIMLKSIEPERRPYIGAEVAKQIDLIRQTINSGLYGSSSSS